MRIPSRAFLQSRMIGAAASPSASSFAVNHAHAQVKGAETMIPFTTNTRPVSLLARKRGRVALVAVHTQRIAFALALVCAGASGANAQVQVNAGPDVYFKLGILGQFQADTLEDPPTDTNINNVFVRRFRLLFGGQVTKNVTFFVETDTPNLGRRLATGKNIQPGVILQDAYGEFTVNDAFAVDAGLMFIPFSRNAVQSAATLLPIDYGAFTFSQSAPTQSSTGRDTGFQAKGYLLSDHLEYRIGVFQGFRNARSSNPFRYAGRAQYDFFDTEKGFFYTGTYLGKKRILAVGAAFDTQQDYHAYDVDAFLDYPVGSGAVTGQFDYNRFNGDGMFVTLPKQNDELLELGYLISAWRLTPVLQWANRDLVHASTGDQRVWSVGANYWWAGHNANIKGAYSRITGTGLPTQNEFTVQLQLFYF